MYPAPAFHFRVVFKGLSGDGLCDLGFQSVSGLEAFVNSEDNHSNEKTTTNTGLSYSNLILRRAVRDIKDSLLTQWVFSWLGQKTIPSSVNVSTIAIAPLLPKALPEVYIDLLDEEHLPYMSWGIANVRPKSWKLSELNAEKNEILFETIELSYNKLTFYPKGIIAVPTT